MKRAHRFDFFVSESESELAGGGKSYYDRMFLCEAANVYINIHIYIRRRAQGGGLMGLSIRHLDPRSRQDRYRTPELRK